MRYDGDIETTEYDRERLLRAYAEHPSQELRNQVVTAYLNIARIIAYRFSQRGVDFDDLFQVASLALVKAVERFDLSVGVKFQSYATPKMVGEVKNYFRDKLHTMNLPRKASALLRHVEQARGELSQTLMRSPTPAELARHLAISEDELIEAMAMQGAMYPSSLDDQMSEDSETSLGALLGREDGEYHAFELRESLRSLLDRLDETERRVLSERFFEERSQREIAEGMGVSQMTISRAERRALERIRQMMKEGD